jgi:Spy/CpxP family protein refolding chaperone
MKRTAIVTLILVMALASPGLAKGPGSGGPGPGFGGDHAPIPPGKWWMMPELSKQLGLTPEEKSRLSDAFYQHREKMIGLRSEMSKQHLELEKLLDAEPFDAAASKAQFAAMKKGRMALSEERFDFLVQVRQLLGLERFQQLKWQFKQFKFKRERFKAKKMMQGN